MNEEVKIPRFDNNLINIAVVMNLQQYEASRRHAFLAEHHPHRLEEENHFDPTDRVGGDTMNVHTYRGVELTDEENKLFKQGEILSPYAMNNETNRKTLFAIVDKLRFKSDTLAHLSGFPGDMDGTEVVDTRIPQLLRFTWMNEHGNWLSAYWRHPYGLDVEINRLKSEDDVEPMRVHRAQEDVDDLGQEIFPDASTD